MKKTFKKVVSAFLALVTLFTFMPLSTQAEESTIKVEAPVIEIRTDRTAYGVYESARVTVEVSPSNEYAVEDVFIGASIDGQLVAVKGGEFSKEIDMLTGGTVCRFDVALSSNASGLNIFQKIIMFFKKLFGTGHSAVEIPEYNFNDGRVKVSESIDISFSSITGTVTVNVWYKDEIETTDTDGDGLIDYVEKANGLNPNKADTDNDGLSDYDEFVIIGTDPTKADTDGNGINDFEDDNDADGLSNGEEIEIGTSANSSDTDGDGLNDKEELETYYTEPSNEDTDGDGATDGWEVENGFDPTWHDESFDISVECEVENLTASVELTISGENAESVNIVPVRNDVLIDETIPGYIGEAFDITAEGDIGIAKISFEFDESLLDDPDFTPVIYCLNEETQSFYAYETKINGNVATAQSTHFSKYILLNKNVYERYCRETYNVDYSKDSGIDSNNDGISDYITKLMCDGVIRTGTGVKIFGNYTYEQIQANDDVDGDGIKNGHEITVNWYYAEVPDDAIEYNEHYYKIFDVGYIWDDAEAYCESIGGYLVTITSQEEQNAVEEILKTGTKNSYWLGAQKRSGNWKWASGEEWGYSKWATGQPDNHCGQEETLMIYKNRNPLHYGSNSFGYWNDLLNDGTCNGEEFFGLTNFGFICEWGTYEVNGHNYTFINSSPIHNDTDKDGFLDYVDPTPNKADVFASMIDYKKYYFEDEITITLFSKQPVWDSRTCYAFSVDTSSGYYASGGSGHAFLGIDYIDETQDYFGYGANTSEFGSSGYPLTAITRKEVPGVWYNELLSFGFSVGKTFVINESDIDSINEFLDDHENDKYQISHNNCTTMAVNILKQCNISPKIYEHRWTASNVLGIATWSYYGYSPADACQDIKENYNSYICYKIYELTDGTKCYGVEVIGNP